MVRSFERYERILTEGVCSAADETRMFPPLPWAVRLANYIPGVAARRATWSCAFDAFGRGRRKN